MTMHSGKGQTLIHQRLSFRPNVECLEDRRLLSGIGFAEHPAAPIGCCGHLLADVDGDGLNDWVWGGSPLQWSPNLGDATFGDPVFIGNLSALNPKRHELLAIDVDGDDDLDLVSQLWTTLTWYENRDGRGRFGPANNIASLGGDIRSIAVGDITGSGFPDIVVSQFDLETSTYQTSRFENRGGGRFTEQPSHGGIHNAKLSDFDGDGDIDLLAVRERDRNLVWLPNNNGELAGEIALAEDVSNFAIGDMNNDGRADVVSTSFFNFTVHINDGTNSVTSTRNDFGFIDNGRVFLADYDDDHDLDVILESFTPDSNFFQLLENLGDGVAFAVKDLPEFERYTYNDVYLGDINGDGGDDLFGDGAWYKYERDSDQIRKQPLLKESRPSYANRKLVDINGDGQEELLYNVRCRSLYIICDYGLYWRTLGPDFTVGTNEHMVVSDLQYPLFFSNGDFDGDGDQDLAVMKTSNAHDPIDAKLVWFENLDGNGTFSEQQDISDSVRLAAPRTVDLNNDGIDEIVARVENGKPIVLRLNGESFESEAIEIENVVSIHVADLNRDGLGDLLIRNNSSLFQVLNSAIGLTAPTAIYELPNQTSSLAVVDINNDNFLDLVLTTGYRSLQNNVENWWIESLADGTFGDRIPISNTNGMRRLTKTDLNSDGFVDLVFEDYDPVEGQQIKIAYNEGNGEFSTPTLLGVNAFNMQSVSEGGAFRDVDGDGDLDVIGHDLTWYENRPLGDANGDGSFDSSDLVQVFQSAEYEDDVPGNSTFQEGDWNGDGDFDSSDLIVAMRGGTYRHAAFGIDVAGALNQMKDGKRAFIS